MLGSHRRNLNPLKIKSIGEAMDVIVIEQPDGSLIGSPFYLRIGRSFVFTALNVTVDLIINDKHIQGIKMRPTTSGLCHFELNSDKIRRITGRANAISNDSQENTDNGFNHNNDRDSDHAHYLTKRISRTLTDHSFTEKSEDERRMLRSFSLPDLYAASSCQIHQLDDCCGSVTGNAVNISGGRTIKFTKGQSVIFNTFDGPQYLMSCDETNYYSILDKNVRNQGKRSGKMRKSVSLDNLRALCEENGLVNEDQDSYSFIMDSSDGELSLSSSMLDIRDVNGKLEADLIIQYIEMCDITLCQLSDRLIDLSSADWKTVDSKSADSIYEPNDTLTLVRLTLEDDSQHYFTSDFLRKNPINLDTYKMKEQVAHTRISYSKYMSLTSWYLKYLHLLDGQNQLQYIIRSSKGPGFASANIFKWKYNDRLVVSDIDGTVTKSDVLGHLFGLVGMDYSHYGVAHLFSKIIKNGYKLMYLSSRPLLQMKMTRNYLNRIREGKWRIPQGPILLSTGSIFSVIHDELFNREKVRDLKARALDRIGHLFPHGYQPFHAAFGNADSDFKAYRLIGIPRRRIFIIGIDGKVAIGKEKVEQSHDGKRERCLDYSSLAELGNLVFPNLSEEVKYFEDYEDMLLWYTSLNPLVEFR